MTTPAKRAEQLAALPSLSHALSSLPQARSLDHVALHHPTLAQRGPESEAKVAIPFLSFFLHDITICSLVSDHLIYPEIRILSRFDTLRIPA